MDYIFQFNVIWQNWLLFLKGALLTIQIASIATGLGLVIGMVMAGLQLMKNPFVSAIIQAYIEVIRNTPFLVQLFFVYFGLPSLNIMIPAGERRRRSPCTINIGAYATEIVRAGVEAHLNGSNPGRSCLGTLGLPDLLSTSF